MRPRSRTATPRSSVSSSSRRSAAPGSPTSRPTSTSSSASRPLRSAGPWNRTDLVKIGPSASDLVNRYEYHLDFPGDPLDAGCDYERWARRLTAGTSPTVYAHVATDPGYPGKLALQYWFFYPFNDFNNTHEGDWEMTQLVFDAADRPRGAHEEAGRGRLQLARGCRARRRGATRSSRSSTGRTRSSTRPPARTRTSSRRRSTSGSSADAGVGCDNTVGPHRELRPVVKTIPSDPAAAKRRLSVDRVRRPLGRAAEGVLQRAHGPEPEGPVDAADRVVAGLARPGVRGAGGRHLRDGRHGPVLQRGREGIEGARPPAPQPDHDASRDRRAARSDPVRRDPCDLAPGRAASHRAAALLGADPLGLGAHVRPPHAASSSASECS